MMNFDSSEHIPILETERLRLRAHHPDDWSDCAKMWADPLVTRYIGGQPFNKEDVWNRLLRYRGLWFTLGFGYWLAEEKSTKCFVGDVGFADFKRDIVPALEGPELGWAFASDFHGRGYGYEAVKAVTHWGDAHLNTKSTSCIIHPDNAPSIHLAEKCGYQRQHLTSYKGHETLVLSRISLFGV